MQARCDFFLDVRYGLVINVNFFQTREEWKSLEF